MCRWVFARIVARSGLVGIGSEYIKNWRESSCRMKHPRICQSSFGNFSSEPSSQPQKPVGLKSTLGTHLPSPPSLPSLPSLPPPIRLWGSYSRSRSSYSCTNNISGCNTSTIISNIMNNNTNNNNSNNNINIMNGDNARNNTIIITRIIRLVSPF